MSQVIIIKKEGTKEDWDKGFNEGVEWAMNNYVRNSDNTFSCQLPSGFIHRGDAYWCGYGEGLISGRHKKFP